MNTHITFHKQLRRHERDVALLGRLFADWSRDSERRHTEADHRLDAIEVQLARLERRMAMPAAPVPIVESSLI